VTPLFLGLAGTVVSPDERALFGAVEPAGYILFRRNIVDKPQLRALTDDLRALSGRADVPILIDQEGGRVARMQPPVWPEFPKAERFDALYEVAPVSAIEAARANAQAIGVMLAEAGINVNCLPLLDVRQPGAHDIIGDRALGSEPMRVAALGRAVIEGMRAVGVVGVIKHMPGHGRAMADSHIELPVVDADEAALATDLEPFITLHDAPMAMTAHVLYPAWDAEQCASLSRPIIEGIIRGRIGFDGLLMSDDLGMHALSGDFGQRTAGVLAAGCDIALHCSGDLAEMEAVAGAVGEIAPKSAERLARAMATVAGASTAEPFEALVARRDALLAHA
jgi:beta-N-acetylhexosaminidase